VDHLRDCIIHKGFLGSRLSATIWSIAGLRANVQEANMERSALAVLLSFFASCPKAKEKAWKRLNGNWSVE
jgi:hypothetical protein